MTPQALAQAYAEGATFRTLMRQNRMQYREIKAILKSMGIESKRPGGANTGKSIAVTRHYCNERKRDCTLTPGAENCALCCANYMAELIVAGARMRIEEEL